MEKNFGSKKRFGPVVRGLYTLECWVIECYFRPCTISAILSKGSFSCNLLLPNDYTFKQC